MGLFSRLAQRLTKKSTEATNSKRKSLRASIRNKLPGAVIDSGGEKQPKTTQVQATTTPATLSVVIRNNTTSQKLYAHVTGTAASGLFFLSSDGKTPYYPASPSSTVQNLQQDCAILVGGPGESTTLTVPQLSGARIWFCQDEPLTFFLNPGPAVVEPSATNPSDPNYNLNWAFCEFTLNTDQLYVNISFVDFVSLPVSLQLENTSGTVTSVAGLPKGGLDAICQALIEQNNIDKAGWDKLVVKTSQGTNLRALSPNSGQVLFPGLFNGYYQSYVNSVWQKYQGTSLTVNTQYTWGDVTGKVDSSGKLNFVGVGSFAQPSAADIFSCSTGPFAGGNGVSDEMLNIGARLAAAFNRSTLLTSATQPDDNAISSYYQNAITNHYSRICHATSIQGRGYAFPYDDVGATNGADQSGFLNDPSPKLLTIGVGAPLSS